MKFHTHYRDIEAFVTKDGSVIRELMHPSAHGVRGQSLAEAQVEPGQVTQLHRHRLSEELYFITAGEGLMTLGTLQFAVAQGDTVCIPPGMPHCIRNTGKDTLSILCACSPAYHHDDTELL